MAARGKWRGHAIVFSKGAWLYADTLQSVTRDSDRDCGHCGKPQTPEGHDGCLGTIPGVVNACCGHGDKAAAYVQYQKKE